jgi:hypothetical protein
MQSEKYSADLKEIRSMMDRSTRFLSLSGLSGVMAGIYALIGAYLAHQIIQNARNSGEYTYGYDQVVARSVGESPIQQLLIIAVVVMILALVTAYFLTKRKAQKTKQNIWGKQTLRLAGSFIAPLIIGGLFTISLLQYELLGLVAPAMLIFYGLACINASKYTLGTVKYLGWTCALLGWLNTQFIGYGLYFWAEDLASAISSMARLCTTSTIESRSNI